MTLLNTMYMLYDASRAHAVGLMSGKVTATVHACVCSKIN